MRTTLIALNINLMSQSKEFVLKNICLCVRVCIWVCVFVFICNEHRRVNQQKNITISELRQSVHLVKTRLIHPLLDAFSLIEFHSFTRFTVNLSCIRICQESWTYLVHSNINRCNTFLSWDAWEKETIRCCSVRFGLLKCNTNVLQIPQWLSEDFYFVYIISIKS